MKLYNSVGPNPKVVRVFMAERGIEMEQQEVDLISVLPSQLGAELP